MSDSQPKAATTRGQKLCGSCGTINGVRAFTCKSCEAEFSMKKFRRGLRKVLVRDFKTLERGDVIRVTSGSGPYYTDQQGERQYMVDRGKYTVMSIIEEGLNVLGEKGHSFLYMGKICPSKLLASITKSPCKVYKIIGVIAKKKSHPK
jgi:hypothetical protein